MLRVLALLLLVLVAAGSGPAAAQDFFRSLFGPPRMTPAEPPPPAKQRQPAQPTQPRALPEREPVRLEEVPPVYAGDMSRLSEILGALHYLHPLCQPTNGYRWREEMQALIEVEQPPEKRRDQLIASFNRSYTSYGQIYTSCTPAAELAIRRYLDEGARISMEMATTHGSN